MAASFEAWIAAGDAMGETWRALARAQQRRTPPNPALPLGGAGLMMRERAGLYAGLVVLGSGPLRLMFPSPNAILSGDGPVTLRAMGGFRPPTSWWR